ncbi:MAG: hypothetical protein ACYDBJ_26625 [Aggregatilineales bacterium]
MFPVLMLTFLLNFFPLSDLAKLISSLIFVMCSGILIVLYIRNTDSVELEEKFQGVFFSSLGLSLSSFQLWFSIGFINNVFPNALNLPQLTLGASQLVLCIIFSLLWSALVIAVPYRLQISLLRRKTLKPSFDKLNEHISKLQDSLRIQREASRSVDLVLAMPLITGEIDNMATTFDGLLNALKLFVQDQSPGVTQYVPVQVAHIIAGIITVIAPIVISLVTSYLEKMFTRKRLRRNFQTKRQLLNWRDS